MMLRDSFYQKIGNPLQIDRLPTRSCFVRLPFLGDKASDVELALAKGVLLITIVDLTGWYMGSGVIYSNARYLLEVCSLLIGMILVASTMLRGMPWLLPAAFVGSVGLFFSVSQPSCAGFRLIAGGIVLSGFIYRFTEHWIELCTTDPMDKAVASRLRKAWYGHLRAVILVPVAAVVVAAYFGMSWLFLSIMGVFGLAQVLLACREPIKVVGSIECLVSWYTYNCHGSRLPGIFLSPSGDLRLRRMLTLGTILIFERCMRTHINFETSIQHAPFMIGAVFLLSPVILPLPILIEARSRQVKQINASSWRSLTSNIRSSPNPIERQSYYMARTVEDGSLICIPRQVFGEHGHFLGGSGAGKTSLGLSPWIEQTIAFGDCSIIVIDLKADTHELLATLVNGADQLRRDRGINLPLKLFSNQDDKLTHGFNPIAQPNWKEFNDYIKTDILCGATGLEYGPDYGAGFYSSANAAVLHHTIKTFPNIKSFREMSDRCNYVLNNSDSKDLHPDIRRAGIHVHEVLKRLAAFDALNVCAGKKPLDVLENSIDLSDVFVKPQLHYFHLSSTLSPGASPALARLVTYFLLASAAKAKRNVPVYLVIDEFQRMVAQNTEYMLQLARSMGVGVILANQSMEDLRTLKSNLIPAIEANCRFRQWFDRRRKIVKESRNAEVNALS